MRTVRLALGDDGVTSTTTLVAPLARDQWTMRCPGDVQSVEVAGVATHALRDGALRMEGVAPGARVTVTSRVAYGSRVHGLARLVDPQDDRTYVVASGALGGAAHFLAVEPGPADRRSTTIEVTRAEGVVVATGERRGSRRDAAAVFTADVPLAGHHLALVAGPFRELGDVQVRVLARRSLARPDEVAGLLTDTRDALRWVSGWFGSPPPVGGRPYTQVLLPDVPWAALEHAGCVLVSERLLACDGVADRARRVAVLAHEVAHQWLGNLVSPQSWSDVGVIEGLAELVGQLACEEVVGGTGAAAYLEHRRAAAPLVAGRAVSDERVAGLAEVAGPAQHAELFRRVRAEVGPDEFRARVRALCRARAGATVSTQDVWSALGSAPRRPPATVLPASVQVNGLADRPWDDLVGLDPATAVAAARRALRAAPPGGGRLEAALAAVDDPTTDPAVAAGLGAELARVIASRADDHD